MVLTAGLLIFPVVGAASKQAMAPLAIALAACLLAATLLVDRRAALPRRSVAWLFAGFVAYVAALHLPPELGDSGWGETVAKLGMLTSVLWLTSASWVSLVDPVRLARIARWALAGLAVGSGFLLIELVFEAPFHRLSDGLDPAVFVDPARYNRPSVALLLISLPLTELLARHLGRVHALAALLLGLAPALMSDSAAAWLAIAAAALVYPTARWRPRPVLLAGAALTAAFVVGAPPLLSAAYQTAVRHEVPMPMSFMDRLEIWDHAASAVSAAPLTGYGLGSVKHLPLSDEQRDRYRYHKAPSTHAHNAALQLWVEFGAVGVAAGLALLGIGVAAIRRMDRRAQAIALATTAALLTIAMLSYGLWQETWLGLIGVTVLLVRLAALPGRPTP